jgi:hypothetical protein
VDPRERQRSAGPASTGRRWGRTLLVAALVGLSPAAAGAQNPLGPLPSQPTQTPTVSVPTTSTPASTTGGDLSTTAQIGLFGAGIVLIGGIAFLIRRDARAAAPVTRSLSADAPRATVKPRAKRVEQSRARAKAARRQRKRSRSR